jgi:hypothetical protein
MPDLNFRVTGVEPAARGLVPLIHFHLEVINSPETQLIQAVMLQAQVQIQSPHRPYDEEEKERLADLFGTPDRWGQTLRNRLWAHANTTVRPFEGKTEAVLPIQCTYDLNVTATGKFPFFSCSAELFFTPDRTDDSRCNRSPGTKSAPTRCRCESGRS